MEADKEQSSHLQDLSSDLARLLQSYTSKLPFDMIVKTLLMAYADAALLQTFGIVEKVAREIIDEKPTPES